MVAVPTGAPSPRTAALVLAVLGYRRRLRRRDRCSRPALLAGMLRVGGTSQIGGATNRWRPDRAVRGGGVRRLA